VSARHRLFNKNPLKFKTFPYFCRPRSGCALLSGGNRLLGGIAGRKRLRAGSFLPAAQGVESMPIYAYKCSACGFAKDTLQKMSDAPLTVCPECGQSTFSKQVTAAGFQLKGSGWYVTDFRNNGTGAAAKSKAEGDGAPAAAAEGGEAKSADAKPAEAKTADAKPADAAPAKPAAAPAVASSPPAST
jgi:putative FmdB family regulatory protein